MDYAFSIVRSIGRTFRPALAEVEEHLTSSDAVHRWGCFFGLFGLASSELVVVTYGEVEDVDARFQALANVRASRTLILNPTVRPEVHKPRTRDGLYVFRFFQVAHKDVETIAQLSFDAWQYFETSTDYAAEPQALFCQKHRNKEFGKMLLCTWYDGLNSWQLSRESHPQARENFRQREQLTLGTKPYATRLIVR